MPTTSGRFLLPFFPARLGLVVNRGRGPVPQASQCSHRGSSSLISEQNPGVRIKFLASMALEMPRTDKRGGLLRARPVSGERGLVGVAIMERGVIRVASENPPSRGLQD
jgi:hypothetical protein